MLQLDNPHIRASRICPLCDGPKERRLLACWPCFRRDLKNGNPLAERVLELAEVRLAADSFVASRGGLPL
jgi:hypothetical protein